MTLTLPCRLFSGTVRHNLNPTGSASATDEELWRALTAVQLKRAIQDTGLGLDAPVAEFGENFSQGQRQLLSLARAMLRNTRVVCLDEATASVDLESDAAMGRVIAEQFADCTVLVIAHRLHTIIDSDTVCCMSNGELVARGSPAELLADPSSIFSQCVLWFPRRLLFRGSLCVQTRGRDRAADVSDAATACSSKSRCTIVQLVQTDSSSAWWSHTLLLEQHIIHIYPLRMTTLLSTKHTFYLAHKRETGSGRVAFNKKYSPTPRQRPVATSAK